MNKLIPTVSAVLLLATPAAAQFEGEAVSFPLGVTDLNNHIRFVTRVKNTNYFTETAIRHVADTPTSGFFDIINGKLDDYIIDPSMTNTVKFYYVHCPSFQYALYATATGPTANAINETIVYQQFGVGHNAGGTTPEGIRAGELCREMSLLNK